MISTERKPNTDHTRNGLTQNDQLDSTRVYVLPNADEFLANYRDNLPFLVSHTQVNKGDDGLFEAEVYGMSPKGGYSGLGWAPTEAQALANAMQQGLKGKVEGLGEPVVVELRSPAQNGNSKENHSYVKLTAPDGMKAVAPIRAETRMLHVTPLGDAVAKLMAYKVLTQNR